MINRESRNLRELEAALGLLKLNGIQMGRHGGRQVRKTKMQTNALHRVFEITRFPSSRSIFDLSLLISIHPKSIQKWFQNTRQSLKKKGSALPDFDEHGIVDIPLPLLAEIVERERSTMDRFGMM